MKDYKAEIEKILERYFDTKGNYFSVLSEDWVVDGGISKKLIDELQSLITQSNKEAVEGFFEQLIKEHGSGKYTNEETWIELTVSSLRNEVDEFLSQPTGHKEGE